MHGRTSTPAGAGPGTIVFCHANGFPAGTYRQLLAVWRAGGWRVAAPERFGHDPAYPVTSNWPRLRDQLVDFVETVSPGQPVHLVGHSLGGYLALLAACRRPALARSLVLVDSPIVTGWRARSVQVMKLGGLFKRVSPGRVSAGRSCRWPSKEAAFEHFAAKRAYARWAPGVLQDYIDCGTEPTPEGGVTLTFRREVETHIYNTLPHHMGSVLRRHPPCCPVAFVGGTRSAENRQAGLATTRALAHGRIEWIEGSHLFPMERPLETAQVVLRLLASLTNPPPAPLPTPTPAPPPGPPPTAPSTSCGTAQ